MYAGIQQLAASFKLGVPRPFKDVSEDAGPHGLSICGTLVGPASHAAPSVLAETSSSSTCLASRTPLCQGVPGLRCSSGPLEEPSVEGTGRAPGHGLQKEGVLERHLQLRLGGDVRWQNGLWPLVKEGRLPSHQLPRNAGSIFGPSHLSARPEGTSCLIPLRQYDAGVLHKPPGQSFLEAPLYSSRAPLEVGSAQLALAEFNACVGQTKLGSRHDISEQCPLRRVDAPTTNGSRNMGNLRQARGRPLRLRRQHSLPNLFFEGQGCVGPRLTQPPPLCFSPDPAGKQANQGTEAKRSVSCLALEELKIGSRSWRGCSLQPRGPFP